MFKSILAGLTILTMLAAGTAGAQTAKKSAPLTKQELAQKVAQLWHVEAVGQTIIQEPVAVAIQQARAMMQSMAAPEKREPTMHEISQDAKKFLDENAPIMRSSAQKFIPTTIIPILMERFTEDELREIVAILESPTKRKFEAMVPELQKTLGEKVANDTRPVVDPKLQELRQHISMRLRAAVVPQ